MCTTGALRTDTGYLLFKNKDFGRVSFEDLLVVEQDVFGIAGVETWAGTDPDLDRFSGFSVGANRHGLLCCDSNVRTVPGLNYDRLTEIALREGTDVRSGVEAVERAMRRHPYIWANLVMIDEHELATVEVRGQELKATYQGDDRIARSNHHVELGATPDDDDTVTTVPRLRSASRRIREASDLPDIFRLQESHDDGDSGICNHTSYDTVYSYVFERLADSTILHVTQGKPCQNPQRLALRLPFGSEWNPAAADSLRDAYPSTRQPLPIA
ncbi:MAG: hypothetical protein J4G00_09685 [Actinomycetia bacterium]|nr:hypothetical protein [Actinomycetes bacterium]